jgi:peptidoglycan hydrolase CwlO-like protein
MHFGRSCIPTTILLTVLAALVVCPTALADSLSVKRAEAAHVEAQVAALNTKAEIASENYNAARARYRKLNDRVDTMERYIAKLEKRQRVLQTHLNTRARDMYRDGPLGFASVLLSVRTFEDFDATIRVLTSLNAQDAATVAQLKGSKAAAQKARATLVASRAEAAQQKTAMARNAAAVG